MNIPTSPIGAGIFAGVITLAYLILMSINAFLPPVLLLSFVIGYIVYRVQSTCAVRPSSGIRQIISDNNEKELSENIKTRKSRPSQKQRPKSQITRNTIN
jgi:hypothetical protein